MTTCKVPFIIEPSFEKINEYLDGMGYAPLENTDFIMPYRATEGAAAFDIFAQYDFTVETDTVQFVDLGFKMEIPDGYMVKIIPRSGHGSLRGLTLRNSTGLIDDDYTKNWGAVLVLDKFEELEPRIGCTVRKLREYEGREMVIKRGTAFAQMTFEKKLDTELVIGKVNKQTNRKGGHGSTGN